MKLVRLGRTELMVTKTAFGALPIQRISRADAVRLVRHAYEGGINYFDTANAYSDSEEKLGEAFEGIRQNVIISTKTGAKDKATAMQHIELSLKRLRTDYIDLLQFHNPEELPSPEDPDGPYAAALEMQKRGYVRHIGITNHRLPVAKQAIASGWYETLQFPFSHISSQADIDLMHDAVAADMGFIAMKGLSGGLLNNAAACYAFMKQHESVVPIWGIQKESELQEWLELAKRDPDMDETLAEQIEKDRRELGHEFCRGCGYCKPCTVGIRIDFACRMNELLHRGPYWSYLTDEWYEEMQKIADCVHCDLCKSRCPYGLDTPKKLEWQLQAYNRFYAEHHNDPDLRKL